MEKVSLERIRNIIKAIKNVKNSQSIHLTHEYRRSDIIGLMKDICLTTFIVDLNSIEMQYDEDDLADEFAADIYQEQGDIAILIVGLYMGHPAHQRVLNGIFEDGRIGGIKIKEGSPIVSMIENVISPSLMGRMCSI